MTTFEEELKKKKFQGNVVVRFGGVYYAIRAPDSGLFVLPLNKIVSSVSINPTSIDIRRSNVTIASYTVSLLDKNYAISKLVRLDGSDLINLNVEIWIGRTQVGMDFSNYFKLPITKIKKIAKKKDTYEFSTMGLTDQIDVPIYQPLTRLAFDIFSTTTDFKCMDDTSFFPASGELKIEDEIISYSSKNDALKDFSGILRGLHGTTAADHSSTTEVDQSETIEDHPLNMLLRILTSGGGGGPYDNLKSGCGISPVDIDVAGIEALRDSVFKNIVFKMTFYQVDSALRLIEDEILAPLNCRFSDGPDATVTVKVLNKAIFVEPEKYIDNDTISEYPNWTSDVTKVMNNFQISYGYNEATGQFDVIQTYQDDASIALYGKSAVETREFKGPQVSLGGKAFIDAYAAKQLARLSVPQVEVSLKTHLDKSSLKAADASHLKSTMIPAADGTLTLSADLEVISAAVSYLTGDVSLKLAYTSYSDIRSGFIAPSDLITAFSDQRTITLAADRGAQYLAGWIMGLWDDLSENWVASEPLNTIESITGDVVRFKNNFVATLIPGRFRIRFAAYDECSEDQKRYCFISQNGDTVFPSDNQPVYKITF